MSKPTADTVLVVSHRTFVLPTTTGHSFAFVKGETVTVPRASLEEVMRAGVIPAEEADLPKYEENAPAADGSPVDPTKRKAAVKAAILELRKINNREAFAASGAPKVGAVEKILGWETSAKEIAAILQEIHNEAAGEA